MSLKRRCSLRKPGDSALYLTDMPNELRNSARHRTNVYKSKRLRVLITQRGAFYAPMEEGQATIEPFGTDGCHHGLGRRRAIHTARRLRGDWA